MAQWLRASLWVPGQPGLRRERPCLKTTPTIKLLRSSPLSCPSEAVVLWWIKAQLGILMLRWTLEAPAVDGLEFSICEV